jgi:hypothetical protein
LTVQHHHSTTQYHNHNRLCVLLSP